MPSQEPKTNSSQLYLRLRKMDGLGLVLTLTHIQNTFYSQLTVKIPTSWQMMCYMSMSVWNIGYNSVCSSLSPSVCSTALCKYSQELHHVVTGNRLNTIPFFPQTQVQNRVPLTWCFSESTAAIQRARFPASAGGDVTCEHRFLLREPLCLYLWENERVRGAQERGRAIYSSATISSRASVRITHTHSPSLPLFPLDLSILPFSRL